MQLVLARRMEGKRLPRPRLLQCPSFGFKELVEDKPRPPAVYSSGLLETLGLESSDLTSCLLSTILNEVYSPTPTPTPLLQPRYLYPFPGLLAMQPQQADSSRTCSPGQGAWLPWSF